MEDRYDAVRYQWDQMTEEQRSEAMNAVQLARQSKKDAAAAAATAAAAQTKKRHTREQFDTQLGVPSGATGSTEDTARAAEMATEKGGDLAEGFRAEMTGESIPSDAIYKECIERLFGANLNYTAYRQQWRIDHTLPPIASGTDAFLKARTLLEQYAPELRIPRPFFGPRSMDQQLVAQYEEIRIIVDGYKFLKAEGKADGKASKGKEGGKGSGGSALGGGAGGCDSNVGATYSNGLGDKLSVIGQVSTRDGADTENHTSGVHSLGQGVGVTGGTYHDGPHDSRSYLPNRKRALVVDQTAGERSMAPRYNPRSPTQEVLHRTFEEALKHPDNVGHAGAPVVYVPPRRIDYNFGQLVPVEHTLVRL